MSEVLLGADVSRVDGADKVRGRAPYAAEFGGKSAAHAVMVTSTVPRAEIVGFNASDVEKLPGVLGVMTWQNAIKLPDGAESGVEAPSLRALSLLQSPRVAYQGQPVAVVIADTLEHAQYAAAALRVQYRPDTAALDFHAEKSRAYAPKTANQSPTASARGDVERGLAASQVRVDAVYTTPDENHNPMEPHATVAVWHGDQLTVWDATQGVAGVRKTLAKKLGVESSQIRVVCPYVGGGFGCKGSTWSHTVLAAMAAKRANRMVRLALERPQMFGPVGNRPRTEQRVILGAKHDGTLQAISHESLSTTSTLEDWVEPAAVITRILYRCDNVKTDHRLVKLNIGTPTFQRAPGEATGSYALECAMDELAVALKMDPVALRLKNYAEKDGNENKPFSSKSLRECYRLAAEKFGWSKRSPEPRSMRDGRDLIGWGMATASYPANRQKASAKVHIDAQGKVLVQACTQDLGTGTYTVLAQIVADALATPLERLTVEIGDSQFPEGPVSGGSMTIASVTPAVVAAAKEVRQRLLGAASGDAHSPLHGTAPDDLDLRDGFVVRKTDAGKREPIAAVVGRMEGGAIESLQNAEPDADAKKRYSMHSFGAVFAEVRVDADLGVIRVARIVAAYGVGKLLNAKTGRSQLQGGIVWGIGMALLEEALRDLPTGRIVNANLAEYHVPVNADVPTIDVITVDEKDEHIGPLGAKGIGEIGITGVAAAIANAVYHATGKRVRDLPITLDKILA